MLDLRAPKKGTKYVAHAGRLALFHRADDAREYWSEYWLQEHATKHLLTAASGKLDSGFDVFFSLLERHLAPGAKILEGGCGTGHLVAALDARGHSAIGVDYVPALVDFAKKVLPALDVRAGDVEQLPFEDAAFDCYASLGVIEHFEDGPERTIAEARRVVRPGGLAIFEVPYLNPLRARLLRRLRPEESGGLSFHQYYYGSPELEAILASHGFELIERVPNCWESVLFREHALLAPFMESRFAIHRVRGVLRRLVRAMPEPGRERYAHTMAFACRRV